MTSAPEPSPSVEIERLTRNKKILRDRLKQIVRLAKVLAEWVERHKKLSDSRIGRSLCGRNHMHGWRRTHAGFQIFLIVPNGERGALRGMLLLRLKVGWDNQNIILRAARPRGVPSRRARFW